MKVAAIMCVWNERNMLPLAVESSKDFVDEYIVVDNNSDDGTLEAFEKCRERWKLKAQVFNRPDLRLKFARMFAIEQTDADWILIQDGDEIYYQRGPNPLQNLDLSKKDTAYSTPMVYLKKDLIHTVHPDVDDGFFPYPPYLVAHPFLYHNNKTLEVPSKGDIPSYRGKGIRLNKIYKFDCSVKSPLRMFLRKYWWSWNYESNAHKTLSLEEYTKKRIGKEDLVKEAELDYSRLSSTLVLYDEKKYEPYPEVIKRYIETGRIRGYEGGRMD